MDYSQLFTGNLWIIGFRLRRELIFTVKLQRMLRKKPLTPEQAYQKLKHYCAYQERCCSDVKTKARSFGLNKTDVEKLTSKLTEEGCLNEERFARQYAGGKFRQNQWGKVKIKAELKKKRVSEFYIVNACSQITEKDYLKTVDKLAKQKWNSIKGAGVNQYVKMTKTRDYLLQKGYEYFLVGEAIKKLTEKNNGAL